MNPQTRRVAASLTRRVAATPTCRVAASLARAALAGALLAPVLAPPARAQTASALEASPTAGGVKVGSPVGADRWRSTTPVPSTWDMTDCRSYAASVAATHAQLGCVFETVVPGNDKFSWGAALPVKEAPTPAHRPVPNCGW